MTSVCTPHLQSVGSPSICSTSGQSGSRPLPQFPLPSPGLGAPTLAEDELLHALLLLVGSLQTLCCALKETLLFGQFGSQFQKFPSHGLSLGKGNRLSKVRRPKAPHALWLLKVTSGILQCSALFLDWSPSMKASKTLQLRPA